jgi:competence protein ComEC
MKMKREAYVALLCAAVMLCAGGLGSTCKSSSASLSGQNTAQLSFSQSSLSLTAIDVGRGDALLLELPNGKTILVDGGGTYSAQQFVIPYLLARHITHLDAIVCTHEHSDHIDGLVVLLRDGRIRVDSAYDSGFPLVQNLRIANLYERASISAYLAQLNEKGIPRTIVKAGDSINVGRDNTLSRDASIAVLSPNQNLTHDLQKLVKDATSLTDLNVIANMDPINENSLVLRISYGQVHFLLAGDTSLPGNEYADAAMLRDPAVSANLSTDVLKLGHHGFSPPDDNFYKVVQPRYVIVTYGPFLFTGEPQCERLGEGAKNIDYFKDQLWNTCDKGTIIVTTDGTPGVYVRSEASAVPKVCCCNCSNPSAPQYAF